VKSTRVRPGHLQAVDDAGARLLAIAGLLELDAEGIARIRAAATAAGEVFAYLERRQALEARKVDLIRDGGTNVVKVIFGGGGRLAYVMSPTELGQEKREARENHERRLTTGRVANSNRPSAAVSAGLRIRMSKNGLLGKLTRGQIDGNQFFAALRACSSGGAS
jgi:hypothetical protein